nr:4'-phosphopantetheinyl transferase superfamily protein [Aeromonas cavernicola]
MTEVFLLKPASMCAAALAQLATMLTADEYHQWQTRGHDRRRLEYLVSRGVLRHLLAVRLNQPANRFLFCAGEHGKPALSSGHWHFNLSHSGDWLVFALCQHHGVGVDLELGGRRYSCLALARRFFTASEYEWLSQVPIDEQERAFYRLWSRKEAVLKAHGGGISAGLDKVCFMPEKAWQLDNQLDAISYYVQDWPFASGWLCLASMAPSVSMYHIDCNLNSYSIDPMLIHTLFEESNS